MAPSDYKVMLDAVLAEWRKRIARYCEVLANGAAGKEPTAAALLAEMDQVVDDFIALTGRFRAEQPTEKPWFKKGSDGAGCP